MHQGGQGNFINAYIHDSYKSSTWHNIKTSQLECSSLGLLVHCIYIVHTISLYINKYMIHEGIYHEVKKGCTVNQPPKEKSVV